MNKEDVLTGDDLIDLPYSYQQITTVIAESMKNIKNSPNLTNNDQDNIV